MVDQANHEPLVESWQPEPLVPEDFDEVPEQINYQVLNSKPGRYISLREASLNDTNQIHDEGGTKNDKTDTINKSQHCKTYLNATSHNFLGLAEAKRLEEAAIEACRQFGVGSCGPRAFYGTMDVHLRLEEQLADFLGVQEVVLYSFSFSTISSAIPAYVKRGDVVFVDERCNFVIRQGVKASRADLVEFKHNDARDLELKVGAASAESFKRFGDPRSRRFFVVVEAVYADSGDLCNFPELVAMKNKLKLRFFVDESRSFGVLGKTGKGITEHFGINIDEVDVTMASLENSLCAYGGFTAGSNYVMDHQRLAGSGYCFSASLPPFQTRVALEALAMIREDPSIVSKAQDLYEYAHQLATELSLLESASHRQSPIKVLHLRQVARQRLDAREYAFLDDICKEVRTKDSIYILTNSCLAETNIRPAIRVSVNACLTRDDVKLLFEALKRAEKEVLVRWPMAG